MSTWIVETVDRRSVTVDAKQAIVLPNGCLIFDSIAAWRENDGPVDAGRGWAPGQWVSFRPVTQEELAKEE